MADRVAAIITRTATLRLISVSLFQAVGPKMITCRTTLMHSRTSFALALGMLIVKLTGFVMYGYEPDDPWQSIGAAAFWLSPLGLPLLAGAPVVVALDLIVAGWRVWMGGRSGGRKT